MGVTVPGGHIRYLMNKEICLGNPSKKKRRALLNILETEDSHMEHDEIILKNSETAKSKQLDQFYNIFCTLRNSRTLSPLQWLSFIFHFAFSWVSFNVFKRIIS